MPYLKASAQDEQVDQDAAYIEKGRELFRQHCAACHGPEARGDGPVAAQLKKRPSDLTVIQKRGEAFPIYKVMAFIDGEKVVPAHGTREMPIWGKVFRRTEGEAIK
jgi:mono/diheme cytochrome c family protein